MKLQDAYAALPAPLQHAAASAYGARLNLRRYSGDYRRRERDAFARERWSAGETAEFVDARLRRVVAHAAAYVPYYRDLFARLGIRAADIRTTADLAAALPPLEKRTVQERATEFVSERRAALRGR